MERIKIKQFVHDGYILYYTEEAIKSGHEIIGFYFDGHGFPQSIHRNSFYGSHILIAEKL